MKYIAILALLLVAGCKLDGATGVKADRIAGLKAASARAAAHADSVTGTAKVAAVMEANDITLPQVAAYLFANGWTIVPAPLPTWSWTPAQPGTQPIAYYVCQLSFATGSPSAQVYLPQASGPYRVRVKAVDAGMHEGPWSILGWSDGGDGSTALPGVGE